MIWSDLGHLATPCYAHLSKSPSMSQPSVFSILPSVPMRTAHLFPETSDDSSVHCKARRIQGIDTFNILRRRRMVKGSCHQATSIAFENVKTSQRRGNVNLTSAASIQIAWQTNRSKFGTSINELCFAMDTKHFHSWN